MQGLEVVQEAEALEGRFWPALTGAAWSLLALGHRGADGQGERAERGGEGGGDEAKAFIFGKECSDRRVTDGQLTSDGPRCRAARGVELTLFIGAAAGA